MNKIILAACFMLFCFVSTQAHAARNNSTACIQTGDIMRPCAYNPNIFSGVREIKVRMRRERTVRAYVPADRALRSRPRIINRDTPVTRIVEPVVNAMQRVANVATQFLPHPAGCPRSAFCGCGAAQELGLRDRSLWLAASWFKFPRSAPAPGTAAVRQHHVFVLKQHVGGDKWLVADYNSGGRMSRLHVRSINGYTIVRPS